MPVRCVVGFSVHTGWAACVIAGGTIRAPHLVLREIIVLLPRRAGAPRTLIDAVGKKVGRPWGKDQKLAALAAWSMLR